MAYGRVRRRWFKAGAGPSRSSTEVVAERVARSADKRKAAAVLAKAIEAVHAGGDAGG